MQFDNFCSGEAFSSNRFVVISDTFRFTSDNLFFALHFAHFSISFPLFLSFGLLFRLPSYEFGRQHSVLNCVKV